MVVVLIFLAPVLVLLLLGSMVLTDNTISGTSMASPHVAGVAMKLMWEYQDYDADKIKDEMLSIATQNKLSVVRGSPNKLTFHGCID